MSTSTATSSRAGAAANSVLPKRPAPVLKVTQQRQPFRVLHTSRAPAQLSLFLRPGL